MENLTIPQLISKFQATTSASWKSRYLNGLKERKDEVTQYFNSLSQTEEQKIQPVINLIL